ncbi:MAG: hypothetical protein CM1200mP36_06630 [Gammaproteobacteria bacterium]|nr:MAG: hypothetical protein CM1200mP36_06630 [Gammaproteobacteria bacterium]
MRKLLCILTAGFLALVGAQASLAQDMTFFITSNGSGNGGDLGGIDGADAHCQNLAESAGAGDKTWRAYLATEPEGSRGVDARSRIGDGPWHNPNGELIAVDVDDLHLSPNIVRRTSLDENGDRVLGRGDSQNRQTCLPARCPTARRSSLMTLTIPVTTGPEQEGSAMVGHFDRQGGNTLGTLRTSPGAAPGQIFQATGGEGFVLLLRCGLAEAKCGSGRLAATF